MWEHPIGNMKNGPKNKFFFSQKFALKEIQEKKKKQPFVLTFYKFRISFWHTNSRQENYVQEMNICFVV